MKFTCPRCKNRSELHGDLSYCGHCGLAVRAEDVGIQKGTTPDPKKAEATIPTKSEEPEREFFFMDPVVCEKCGQKRERDDCNWEDIPNNQVLIGHQTPTMTLLSSHKGYVCQECVAKRERAWAPSKVNEAILAAGWVLLITISILLASVFICIGVAVLFRHHTQ